MDGGKFLLTEQCKEGLVVQAEGEVRVAQYKEPALVKSISSSQCFPFNRVVA